MPNTFADDSHRVAPSGISENLDGSVRIRRSTRSDDDAPIMNPERAIGGQMRFDPVEWGRIDERPPPVSYPKLIHVRSELISDRQILAIPQDASGFYDFLVKFNLDELAAPGR